MDRDLQIIAESYMGIPTGFVDTELIAEYTRLLKARGFKEEKPDHGDTMKFSKNQKAIVFNFDYINRIIFCTIDGGKVKTLAMRKSKPAANCEIIDAWMSLK